MRCIGQGYAGARKCCGLMNIPGVPTKNNFDKISRRLKTKVFKVVEDSMMAPSKDLHADDKADKVITCGVSVDGTWQKCGYASLNGCVAALSIDTGKSWALKQCLVTVRVAKSMKKTTENLPITCYGKQQCL